MPRCLKIIFPLTFSIFLLSGCAAIVGSLGLPSAIVETLNIVGISTTVYDGIAIMDGNKTINDQILSTVTSKDCKTVRFFNDENVCRKEVYLDFKL